MPTGTVLVIDDEPQIRRVVRNALAADGARVIEAATGAEGIDAAAAQRPSLIVLDLGLPDAPASRSVARSGAGRPSRSSSSRPATRTRRRSPC
jgi:two-component system KDP operon response regulator KdpE